MGHDGVRVGYVRRAHALRGDVIVASMTDDPERFHLGAEFTTDEVPPRRLVVASVRPHGGDHAVRFESISNRTDAEKLRGVSLWSSHRRLLGEGEFWPDELVGLDVVDSTGALLGSVEGVEFGHAQDRLSIRVHGRSVVEVPFVTAVFEPLTRPLVAITMLIPELLEG